MVLDLEPLLSHLHTKPPSPAVKPARRRCSELRSITRSGDYLEGSKSAYFLALHVRISMPIDPIRHEGPVLSSLVFKGTIRNSRYDTHSAKRFIFSTRIILLQTPKFLHQCPSSSGVGRHLSEDSRPFFLFFYLVEQGFLNNQGLSLPGFCRNLTM